MPTMLTSRPPGFRTHGGTRLRPRSVIRRGRRARAYSHLHVSRLACVVRRDFAIAVWLYQIGFHLAAGQLEVEFGGGGSGGRPERAN